LGEISTGDLVEALLPEARCRGHTEQEARKRLYRALMTLAENSLGDCATRGPEKKNKFGGTMRPWLWHGPKEAFNDDAIANLTQRGALKMPVVCPHCGKRI
jgi:hypothetical protein